MIDIRRLMDLFYYKEYKEKIILMYKSKYLRKINLRSSIESKRVEYSTDSSDNQIHLETPYETEKEIQSSIVGQVVTWTPLITSTSMTAWAPSSMSAYVTNYKKLG